MGKPESSLKDELVFRQIGNRVLWSQGDSTSRVLPISKTGKGLFTISFEKEVSINADTLYRISSEELKKVDINAFSVSLKDCKNDRITFSFLREASGDSSTPCLGREIPEGCYKIDIQIREKESENEIQLGYLLLFILPLAGCGLWYYSKVKVNPKTKEKSISGLTEEKEEKIIGKYKLDKYSRVLTSVNESIPLSDREERLLLMLFENLGQPLQREILIEKLWHSEGLVVVSKNLDVLVSKLRKKLAGDPNLRIVSVHGIGYKLEIGLDISDSVN
jgi:DNA-binding winged helix-turn-helix (wHTH) protein